jgi:hypothetical protein
VTEPTPARPALPVMLREPSIMFLSIYLIVVFVVGLTGTAFLAGFGKLQMAVAEGLAIPAALATALCGLLAGVHLRRGIVKSRLSVALRTAAAWGVTGAVWPASNAVADLMLGNGAPSFPVLVALTGFGAVIGATAGVVAGAAAAFAATK